MELKKDMKWLCENARTLEKFSGRWVVFNSEEGVVGSDSSLQKVLKTYAASAEKEKPFVFHVPSREQLDSPVIGTRKK